jgi:coenzyme Q-binding protein COQ10
MSEVKQSIEVNVGQELFFDVISDYVSYPTFLAEVGVRNVTIDKSDGNTKVVTQELEVMGKSFSLTLRMQEDRPSKISWSLVKGELVKMNNGSWTLEKLGPKKTRATYSLEVRFGMFVPGFVANKLAAMSLQELLKAFKKRAESRKKK